jgi:hypothetical protein
MMHMQWQYRKREANDQESDQNRGHDRQQCCDRFVAHRLVQAITSFVLTFVHSMQPLAELRPGAWQESACMTRNGEHAHVIGRVAARD